MKLAEFIVRDAIVCGLSAATKEQAIEQIVESLAQHGRATRRAISGTAGCGR